MTSILLPHLVGGFFMLVVWMGLLWVGHLKLGNAGIVDFGWATGLALLATCFALSSDGWLGRRVLIAALVDMWSIRLAIHLWVDRVWKKPEDPRYATIRQSWRTHLPAKFFLFFQFQGLLDVILSLPFLLMCINTTEGFRPLEWIGAGLWLFAVIGESTADRQLKMFKANPVNKGKTCQSGLWNYSRHPNYFFEWCVWLGFWTMASASPNGWVSAYCPILMLYFLFKVTGIPATEAQAIRSRGDEYIRYQRTTSAFVPWFKKEDIS